MTSYAEVTRSEEAPPDLFAQPPAPPFPPDMPKRDQAGRLARRDALRLTDERLHQAARAALPDLTYHIWIRPIQVVDAAGDRIFIGAPPHIRTWVAERYANWLEHTASDLAGRKLTAAIVPLEAIDPAAASAR